MCDFIPEWSSMHDYGGQAGGRGSPEYNPALSADAGVRLVGGGGGSRRSSYSSPLFCLIQEGNKLPSLLAMAWASSVSC